RRLRRGGSLSQTGSAADARAPGTAATGSRSGASAAAPTTTAAAPSEYDAGSCGAQRRGNLRAKVPGSGERGKAARRRLFRSGPGNDPRRGARAAAEERRLDEEVGEHSGNRRGPLRFARELRVQPGA